MSGRRGKLWSKGGIALDQEWLFGLIRQFGCPALFLALALSAVGLPVPDEVVAVTAGAAARLGVLAPLPAFLATALGTVAGRSVGYLLGRMAGGALLARPSRPERRERWGRWGRWVRWTGWERWARWKRWERWREPVEGIRAQLDRYGSAALCLAVFLPTARHLVPLAAGWSGVAFRRFARWTYPAGVAWALLYFSLGRQTAGAWEGLAGYAGYATVLTALLSGLMARLLSRRARPAGKR